MIDIKSNLRLTCLICQICEI